MQHNLTYAKRYITVIAILNIEYYLVNFVAVWAVLGQWLDLKVSAIMHLWFFIKKYIYIHNRLD